MLIIRVLGSEALGATKRVSLLTSVSQQVERTCGSVDLSTLSLDKQIRQVGQEVGIKERCHTGKF